MLKKILLVLILLLLGLGCTALFTDFGNKLLAQLASKIIKNKTNIDLNISEFRLRFSSLSLRAKLDKMATLSVDGALAPLRLGFDLNYKIAVDEAYVKQLGIKLGQKLEFAGRVGGVAGDFNVSGEGFLFGSAVNLRARILNYSPLDLSLNAPKIELSQLLALVNKPPYATGQISLQAKISATNPAAKDPAQLKPEGNALIKLDIKRLNYAQIKKDFGLDLPARSELGGQILASIKDGQILASSKLANDFLIFSTQKSRFDPATGALNTDFKLQIPSLAKLEKLTKTRLNGPLTVSGELGLANKAVQSLRLDLGGLGGEARAELRGEILKLFLKNLRLEKIFSLLGQPSLASGSLDGSGEFRVNLTQPKNTTGSLKISSSGTFNAAELGKLSGKNFPKNSKFEAQLKADLANFTAKFSGTINSQMASVRDLAGSFDLNKMALKSSFELALDDFSKLGFLLDRKLSGRANFAVEADFSGAGGLAARVGSEDLFGGKLKATLTKGRLRADATGLDLLALARGLDLLAVYDARAELEAEYELATQQGWANLLMRNGRLVPNLITQSIFLLTQKDLSKAVFHTASAAAKLNKKLISFNAKFLADGGQILIDEARLAMDTGLMNVPFNASLDKANIKGVIRGSSQKPQVKIDGKSVLNSLKNSLSDETKQKIDKEINKQLNNFLKKLF